jgi:DNA polymerase-3 subunit beta
MKVVLPRKDLARLIGRCLPATSARAIMPHSQAVLLSAEPDPNQLRMSAVGERLSVDSTVVAEELTPGTVVVEARRLQALVEAMPEGSVTLAVAKERLTVSSGKRRYSLPTMAAEDFPKVPEMPENEKPYLIGSQALAHVIETTRFAMDEGREQYNGILLRLSRGSENGQAYGQLEGYGFRGSCVAKSIVRAPGVVMGETDLFLPEHILSSVLSLCKESPNVSCDVDESRLYVETEDTLVAAALPAAPAEWGQLMKHLATIAQDPVCAIDGPLFLGALKAMLTADPQVCVRVELNAPTLDLSVPELDQQKTGLALTERLELHAGATDARGAHAVMQASILAHAVEACDVVQLRISGEVDPVCVRAADGMFMAIVMPMMR